MNDAELLQAYVQSHSEPAFRTLIDRYIRLVYSFCVRQLKDQHLAEDATQAVFVLLSQKAAKLRGDKISGWLLTAARYACNNIRKTERRREFRERAAAMKETIPAHATDVEQWTFGLLDQGLTHLAATDREALVLRFYEDQSLHDIGQTLGISEEAARKRVDRGLEKLRRYLSPRCGNMTSAGLAALLPKYVQSVQPSSSLAANILQSCHSGTVNTIAQGIKAMMLLTKLKTAVVALLGIFIFLAGWKAVSSASKPGAAAPTQLAADDNPPMIDTTPVVLPVTVDLSTPEKTFETYANALRASDGPKAYTCLEIGAPPPQPTANTALTALELAKNHLVRAANAAFGPNNSANKGGTMAEMLELINGLDKMQHVSANINGDTATLPVSFPDLIIQHSPLDVQDSMRRWNGTQIHFKKIGTQWKITSPQIHVDILLTDQTGKRIDDAAIQIAAFREYARIDDSIATEIENHQYKTWDEAADAKSQQVKAALAKYHAKDIDCVVSPPATQP